MTMTPPKKSPLREVTFNHIQMSHPAVQAAEDELKAQREYNEAHGGYPSVFRDVPLGVMTLHNVAIHEVCFVSPDSNLLSPTAVRGNLIVRFFTNEP